MRKRRLYKGCHDMPMNAFIKMVVENDLESLYSESKSLTRLSYSDKYLNQHWENIMDEFRDLTNDSSVSDTFYLIREYTFLVNKIELADRTIRMLSMVGYNKGLCDVLVSLGFRYQFKPETLARDITMVINNCKSIILKINQYSKQVEELYQDSKAQEIKATDYDTLTVALERHHKVPIDLSVCTVAKFIAYLNITKANG